MSPELLQVPVEGGTLTVARWGDDPGVLAVHGITSSHLAWALVAERLPGLVAPDLRGRGGSAGLPGPFGMAAHADDLARVLDALAVDRAVVVGHSMGGFVAVVLADRHPDRVERLVLVDGGLPLPPPPGLTPDEVLDAVIGPAAQRLAMTFASREEHLDFWRAHPALGPHWSPAVEAYLDYDLVGAAPELRSRTSYDAVRADSIDLGTGEAYAGALERLRHPTAFLRAERGMLDQPDGLYAEDAMREAAARLPRFTARTVPGVNHYTISLSPEGAAAIAEAARPTG